MIWTVLAIALGVMLGASLLVLFTLLVLVLDDMIHRRRRAHHRHRRLEDDGHDAVEAWMEPIPLVWPARAPRNGSPFDDAPGHEEAPAS